MGYEHIKDQFFHYNALWKRYWYDYRVGDNDAEFNVL